MRRHVRVRGAPEMDARRRSAIRTSHLHGDPPGGRCAPGVWVVAPCPAGVRETGEEPNPKLLPPGSIVLRLASLVAKSSPPSEAGAGADEQ